MAAAMYFNIDSKIFEQHPDLKIGVILIKGINNAKRVSTVESLLRGICAQREKEIKGQDIFEHPAVKIWCHTYGRFGVNPKKYPPSIAALLKRVEKGKGLPHINVLVDLYNYFSLKYLLPIGGEDLDWLCGDLNLTFTKGGEPFRPIGSIEVENAAEGEAAYVDEGGITCRYWNYRECERTKFTPRTQNAVLFIEDLSKMHLDQFGKILKNIETDIQKYIGGKIETDILNEENRSINLGIEGRKNVDDSKIPKQEKAHYLREKQESESSRAPVEPKKKASKSGESSRASFKPRPILESENLLKNQLKALLSEALKNAYPKAAKIDIAIEYPATEEHGDYASNISLTLTKILKTSPQEIAKKIISKLPKNDLIANVDIAGPGFINFFISETALLAEVTDIIDQKNNYGNLALGKKQKIIVEYSQPNIAKPLGVHHLLSTIIGQSIYNIYRKLGFETISINHIGDWGTQFGKLIYAYKRWGDKKTIEKDPINELLKLYVKFHEESEKDSSLEDFGRAEFKKFEEGDKENQKLWQWFVDESLKEINKTYDLLGGIHFDYIHGESFYKDKMDPIFEDGKKKGVFEKGEEGAYVINFDDPNIPTVPIKKKDGTTLYITRDFATLKYRIDTFKPTRILYVVDLAQTLHFKQLFAGAEKLGWYNGCGVHVWFGRMHFKDGEMSTRKGKVVLLNDVIEEAIKRARKIIEEKNPELKDKEDVARAIGIGAVKYNILSQNRTSDITFDWDRMLSLEGNSAPYLQYSYARARSILRKKGSEIGEDAIKDSPDADEKIRSLLRLLPKFKEQIIEAARDYKPNLISNYLYDLAQNFNSFYNIVSVLRAENEENREKRLQLVIAVSQILKNGLALLGVEVVEEM